MKIPIQFLQIPINNTEIKLSTEAQYQALPCTPQQNVLSMISLAAPQVDDRKFRPSIDLVAVVDKSSSMSGRNIQLVKNTLQFIIKQLTKNDKLAVITYSDSAQVEFGLTSMDDNGKKAASEKVNNITTCGYTNLSGGLQAGVKLMKQRLVKNDVSTVLLFTDGLANRGITDADSIVHWMKYGTEPFPRYQYPPQFQQSPIYNQYSQMMPQQDDFVFHSNIKFDQQNNSEPVSNYCTVNTFGFGNDHDPDFLRKIANEGKGVYFFIKNQKAIPDAFVNCLGGLLSTVANNIVVTVEALNNVVIKEFQTSYSTICISQNKKYDVLLNDLQSEEKRDILLVLDLPKIQETYKFPILDITLTYKNLITGKHKKMKTAQYIPRPSKVDKLQPSYKVNVQRNRWCAVTAMQDADRLASLGKFKDAQDRIDEAIQTIQKSISANDPFCKGLVNDLLKSKQGIKDKNAYESGGRHYNMCNFVSHQQQRMTDFEATSQAAYMNNARFKMQQAYYQ